MTIEVTNLNQIIDSHQNAVIKWKIIKADQEERGMGYPEEVITIINFEVKINNISTDKYFTKTQFNPCQVFLFAKPPTYEEVFIAADERIREIMEELVEQIKTKKLPQTWIGAKNCLVVGGLGLDCKEEEIDHD